MQQRKDEILAKKAKLAELKRQRELRQKEFSQSKQSIGDASDLISPTPGRGESRQELNKLISSLVDRPGSAALKEASEVASPRRGSRPSSILSTGQLSGDNADILTPPTRPVSQSIASQTLSTAPLSKVFEVIPDSPLSPQNVAITYSKAVQTTELWSQQSRSTGGGFSDSENEGTATRTPKASKRLSRRERERNEEIRGSLRKEIEEELNAAKQTSGDRSILRSSQIRYPLGALTNDELNAVTASDDFLDFVERSSKVIERALDEEYDVLADYALGGGTGNEDDEDEYGAIRGKKRRDIKEVAQFWDERWSKKRMISDISFSPKFPELVLASYTKNPSAPHDPDGLLQIWNLHLHNRPEYIFQSTSDILTATFSPFHPHLIIGGTYSGQILLWDTRSNFRNGGAPVQKTPLSGSHHFGHTHPIYSISLIGTQNAHNILSASTDGVLCGWTIDMLSQPQEYLELNTPPPSKTEDLAPTALTFPASDPTFFLTGTEEGVIYPCHRYDRAGAPAGVDKRLSYRGHTAPITSLVFHPARGPVDLGALALSSSLDWSLKLWRVKPPSASTSSAGNSPEPVDPILDIPRDDLVYDTKWHPLRPSIFSLVTGAGDLEIFDLNVDTEVPVTKTTPTPGKGGILTKSLNKVAWEEREGRRLVTGGLDGVVSVFEVGGNLAGQGRAEEWSGMKRGVSRWEGQTQSRSKESRGR